METKSIFENSKFGDKFRTRDGRMAILWCYHVGNNIIDQAMLILPNISQVLVNGNGKDLNEPYHNTKNDIVAKWQEPINEEELDRLANDYRESKTPVCWWENDGTDCVCESSEIEKAFKLGYRKAKSE